MYIVKHFISEWQGCLDLEHMSSAGKHFVADYKATLCIVNMTFIAQDSKRFCVLAVSLAIKAN